MRKFRKKIAGNGYTSWASDREIANLARKMSKSDLTICHNQALIALKAMDSIYNRLSAETETFSEFDKIGQDFYNLLGSITSALEVQNASRMLDYAAMIEEVK